MQIAIILYKLHHAVGILWNNSHDDGNFDIGIYQYSGDNEGCYDVGEQNLKSLIRGYCKTGTIKDVNETIEALRAICPRVERCRNRDLVAVNNGIYDYGNKILMAFDPAFVFTSKKHVDFVDRAPEPRHPQRRGRHGLGCRVVDERAVRRPRCGLASVADYRRNGSPVCELE